jgi:hypothetical protein
LLPAGTPIEAALTKSIDSKKLKPGDPVVAEASESTDQNGKPLIPHGTKIEGHVTQASARGKGDAFSSVGVVFDKAVLKDGQQIPLNVSVQALALSQNAATAPSVNPAEAMPPVGSPGTDSPAGRMGAGAPMGQPSKAAPATTPTDTVGKCKHQSRAGRERSGWRRELLGSANCEQPWRFRIARNRTEHIPRKCTPCRGDHVNRQACPLR